MNNHKSFFTGLITATVTSLILMTGCSSSGGGGSTTPTLPTDAVTITAANADAIAVSAASTLDMASTLIGVESSLPSFQNAIDIITEQAFNRDKRAYSVVTGITDSDVCPGGGTYNDTWTETATSESGSISYNNCIISSITFNGSFSYSVSWNNTTGDYSASGNGSITITYGSDSFTMALSYSETGNDFNGSFSTTLSYSISGSGFGGFLVETSQPLTGSYGIVTGGQLMVTGANNTRLRITVINSFTATVEFDDGSGTFVSRPNISI